MTAIRNDERGIALAVAIFALVIVGALVAGAFFAGTQEQRVGENSRRMQQSFGVAEVGTAQQVATWDPATRNITPVYPGGSLTLADAPSTSGVYGGRILKLNENLYLIDITGQDSVSRSGRLRAGGARQRIGLLARVMPLQINIQASLTTQGATNLSGNAAVDGNDHTPPGWTDCDPVEDSTAKAGIRVNGSVSISGNATVEGVPKVLQDGAMDDKTFTQYGDINYDQLAARATVKLTPGNYQTAPRVVGATCVKTDLLNWGDGINPNGACANYFPIIHIAGAGTTTLNGVQGQGILLVDGDLNVQGSYEFFGITIIRGALKTAGGGATDAHFWGTVMAQNVDLDLQNLSGKATLNYSKCAILQALQMSQPVAPMVSRGWAQLF